MQAFSFILILANVIFSYMGFRDRTLLGRYALKVDKVFLEKEYWRIITSGFLHVSWPHLIFNMLSLYAFSEMLEPFLGTGFFLLIYFSGLVGGNLFSLFLHRNHGGFSSVGASGAVCGIIFASIALFPRLEVGLFFLPLFIPSWIFGLIYVLYTIWGLRSKHDNVGHEAHLAGALVGMFIAILLYPGAIAANYLPILAITIPCLLFIYIIVKKPHTLLVSNNFFDRQKQDYYSIDHRYNARKATEQKEIDAILEKIHRKGMGSLSKKEKEALDRYSKMSK
ncbi:MAG TPA: rhomboid family intramembrane serine protease [Flavisolibacter sp.]|nr:rhomboid family intramembrane serine protease [Flavisolibacter sp.]